jgi:hypothetical protein
MKNILSRKWLDKIKSPDGLTKSKAEWYLDNDIIHFLVQFGKVTRSILQHGEIFLAIDLKQVSLMKAADNESSMNTVISSVNNYMEMMKDEIQVAYPCYFEKFRTVE